MSTIATEHLPAFSVRRDKQAECWVSVDPYTGIASQGETRKKALANLIEALRLVIKTYQDSRIRIIREALQEREEWIREAGEILFDISQKGDSDASIDFIEKVANAGGKK